MYSFNQPKKFSVVERYTNIYAHANLGHLSSHGVCGTPRVQTNPNISPEHQTKPEHLGSFGLEPNYIFQ